MYSYITQELPHVLKANFPCLNNNKVGLMGHSMGGHGALTIGLKNPHLYKSISAISPICNPTKCPWGVKALTGVYVKSIDCIMRCMTNIYRYINIMCVMGRLLRIGKQRRVVTI